MRAETETHYRSLFNNVPLGLYHFTSDWRIIDANPALVQMLGYPDSETLCAVRKPFTPDALARKVRRVIDGSDFRTGPSREQESI